jgi:hypothetical protein
MDVSWPPELDALQVEPPAVCLGHRASRLTETLPCKHDPKEMELGRRSRPVFI